MLATKIANMLAGIGITVTDGRSVALSTATQTTLANAEQTANKNLANGYAGLNASSELVGPVKILTGTAAEILALTPQAAQPYWTTDTREFGVGDNASVGGVAIGRDNVSNISVYPRHGSAANNGAALLAAYAAARLRLPGGAAISPANPVNILWHGGGENYNSDAAALTLDTSGVNLIGVNNPILHATSTNRLVFNNAGTVLKGFTLRHATAQVLQLQNVAVLTAAGLNYWEDIYFDTVGSTTADVMSTTLTGTIYGTYRNLRTIGERLFGGTNNMTVDPTTLFENCVGGDKCFGSALSVASPTVFGGTLRNCILNGAAWNANVTATGIVEGCTFNNCFIPRLTTGATIRNTTILPASGTCLGNATDTADIKAYQCNLRTFAAATPYGTNITNSVGTDAQAMNVVRDGL